MIKIKSEVFLSFPLYFFHQFFLEKHTCDKIDVSEKTEKKKEKQRKTNYFEMISQTENEKVRAVCFSPEKKTVLSQMKNVGES